MCNVWHWNRSIPSILLSLLPLVHLKLEDGPPVSSARSCVVWTVFTLCPRIWSKSLQLMTLMLSLYAIYIQVDYSTANITSRLPWLLRMFCLRLLASWLRLPLAKSEKFKSQSTRSFQQAQAKHTNVHKYLFVYTYALSSEVFTPIRLPKTSMSYI